MLAINVIALLATTASFAAAQAALPACVLPCYQSSQSAAASCSATDFTCLCKSAPFQAAVGTCLGKTCTTEADIQAGEQFGVTTCKAVGITVVVSSVPVGGAAAGGSTSAAAASTPASSAPASSSAAPTGSSSSVVVTSVSSAAGTSSTATGTVAVTAAPAATAAAGAGSLKAPAAVLAGVLGMMLL